MNQNDLGAGKRNPVFSTRGVNLDQSAIVARHTRLFH
jgi:hypothetical protein